MPSPGSDRESRRLDRKARRQEAKRLALLTTAKEVLVDGGIGQFTLQRVARAANLTKPAVYYYFDSKEALMEALVLHLFDEEIRLIETVIQDAPSGVEALHAMVHAKVHHYLDDPEAYRIVYVWPQFMPLSADALRSRLYPASWHINDMLEKRLQADQAKDRFPEHYEPRRFANLAWLTAHGILSLVIPLMSMGGDMRFTADELIAEFRKTTMV